MVTTKTRRCKVTGETFLIGADEIELYQRLGAPLPTLCPSERQRRRTSYRNFMNLYYRPCSKSGRRVLSMYDVDSPFPVYANSIWWSDEWDPKSYGREYDFNRPFFEQWKELAAVVPRFALNLMQCENSDYANMTMFSRNCYMTFGCINSEDSMFGHIIWECQNCVDCLYGYQCQWCSNSTDIVGCYDVHYSTETVNCSESYFLHDCRSCQNCFGCYNLRNKKYCLFNQQLSRSEYEAQLKRMMPLSAKTVEQTSEWLAQERAAHAVFPGTVSNRSEDVDGNHIYFSTDLRDCFDVKRSEGSRHCYTAEHLFRCNDISFSGGGLNRFCLDSLTITRSEEVLYSHYIIDSSNITLSEFCISSHNLLGCAGLRNSQNCIFNKQYTAEEYKVLHSKIIEQMKHTGEWGEFFPSADSPFAYNESIAADYQPLTKTETVSRDLRWKDALEAAPATAKNAISADSIPQRITQVDLSILDQTFICPETGKQFKFIRPEIEFYNRTQLPLPRKSFIARHKARLLARGPRSSWRRCCPDCGRQFASAIAPERTEQVLCEPCYLAAIEQSGEQIESNGN